MAQQRTNDVDFITPPVISSSEMKESMDPSYLNFEDDVPRNRRSNRKIEMPCQRPSFTRNSRKSSLLQPVEEYGKQERRRRQNL